MRTALLLRGVNVGGVTVRNAELRSCLEAAGFTNVATVLASGNAVVDTDMQAADAAAAARAGLRKQFERDIAVLAIETQALRRVIDEYPYAEGEDVTPYVVFALDDDGDEALERLAAEPAKPNEPVQKTPGALYWSNPKGTTLTSALARPLARAGAHVTTRNLRTLRKIVAA